MYLHNVVCKRGSDRIRDHENRRPWRFQHRPASSLPMPIGENRIQTNVYDNGTRSNTAQVPVELKPVGTKHRCSNVFLPLAIYRSTALSFPFSHHCRTRPRRKGKGDFMILPGTKSFLRPKAVWFLLLLQVVLPLAVGTAQDSGSFEGTLSATGKREFIEFPEGRPVFTFAMEGHVNLKAAMGETENFWANWIGLWDAQTGGVARCVWKDGQGQQIYLVFKGVEFKKGAELTGQIIGGTGGFKGIRGEVTFTWTSSAKGSVDGIASGFAKDLKGTYQIP